MHFTNRMVFLVATLCAFGGLAHAQAVVNETQETATLYVDVVNGNDSNPGTESAPFQTIAKSVAVAEANNQNSIGTHVYINPGLYHENINLTGNQQDTALPETYEAATPGTVLITGADQYTNWTQSSGNFSIYSTPWTYNFGLCPALTGQAPPQTDIVLRREMVFINGSSLEQVLSMSQMLEGTFYVDDSGQQLYIWPPSGTNLSAADVELGDRPQLWNISNKNGVVLRGLTFEYSPDCKGQGSVDVINTTSQNILFDTDNFLWNDAGGLHFSQASNYTVENVISNHNGAVGMEMFDTLNALVQHTTADYNNWRGGQALFFDWAEGGINPYGLSNGTFTDITTDWNVSTGVHWDTNFGNITASNVTARNNLFHGIHLERNTGPMNLTSMTVCNNANEALTAGGSSTTAAGITLRDSENVTLTNSLIYGNGDAQLKVIGVAGGISVPDWLTGQNVTVQNENLNSANNIMEGTDATQSVFSDAQLNGSDWLLFQSTLKSGSNTWWSAYNSVPFVLPVPDLYYATNFAGWQTATLQDLNSEFMEPAGNPQSACPIRPDMQDFWLISNSGELILDPSGHATYTDTVVPLDGFNGTVNFTYGGVSEIPGLSAALAPTTIDNGSGSTAFSITAAPSITPGTYQVTLLANSGATTRTATAFLSVPTTSLRFSTVSLIFPDQQVNTTGNPMTVLIGNFGRSPVNISSIVSSSPVFADTSTCPASLAAGQTCTISVTFTPAAATNYSQTLTISDGDPTSPQIVSMAGTGTPAAEVSLSDYFVAFGGQIYGTTSGPQTVTATNYGSVPVNFNGFSMGGDDPGDFTPTSTCGQQLKPGDSCNITLTFTPQALLNRTASLTINDNTANGMTMMEMGGNGLSAVSRSPQFLAFGVVEIDTQTAPLTVTLTNSGGPLAMGGITFTGANPGDFSQTNNCGTSLPPNSSCTINVVFDPQGLGGRSATMQIADSDPTSPQTVNLGGTGSS